MFLIYSYFFYQFQLRCSYKVCSYKKKVYCSFINTLFTQKTDYYQKELPQNITATVWCLKQFKYFILKVSTSRSFFQRNKVFRSIYYNTGCFLFFQVDVLSRLSIIKQIIKDINMMFISLQSYTFTAIDFMNGKVFC